MSDALDFKASQPLTLGVELELQLVDRRDGDLTRAATDLLPLTRKKHPGLDIKLELTESMIEVATAVQTTHLGILADLRSLRDAVCDSAALLNVGVCGGGAHPFQVSTSGTSPTGRGCVTSPSCTAILPNNSLSSDSMYTLVAPTPTRR